MKKLHKHSGKELQVSFIKIALEKNPTLLLFYICVKVSRNMWLYNIF